MKTLKKTVVTHSYNLHDIAEAFCRTSKAVLVRETQTRKVYRFKMPNGHGYYLKIVSLQGYSVKSVYRYLRLWFEYKHHAFLLKKGATLAQLVGFIRLPARNGGVSSVAIITEEVQDSCPMSDMSELSDEMINKLAQFLINNYRNGFIHKDLHFGNILWNEDKKKFVFVDTGQIIWRRNVGIRAVVKNVVVLYNSFFILPCFKTDQWDYFLNRFINEYLSSDISMSKWVKFALSHTRKVFYRWLNKRTRRCFKQNADFIPFRHNGLRGVCTKDVAGVWKEVDISQKLQALFNSSAQYLKDSRSTCVIKTRLERYANPVVIKRFNVKRRFDPLKNVLRKSRAYRSWWWGWSMWFQKIPVAQPLFFFEQRRFFLLKENFYAMSYYQDTYTLSDYLNSDILFNKKEFLRKFAQLVVKLNNSSVIHRDFQLKNVLVQPSGSDYRFYIIDIESVSGAKIDCEKKLWKHLYQLRKSYLRLNDTGIFTTSQLCYFIKLVFGDSYRNNRILIRNRLFKT